MFDVVRDWLGSRRERRLQRKLKEAQLELQLEGIRNEITESRASAIRAEAKAIEAEADVMMAKTGSKNGDGEKE